MKTFYFKSRAGKIFSGVGKDADRARCAAKAAAGEAWDPSARLFKVGNPILA